MSDMFDPSPEFARGYDEGYKEGMFKALMVFREEIELARAIRPLQFIVKNVVPMEKGET